MPKSDTPLGSPPRTPTNTAKEPSEISGPAVAPMPRGVHKLTNPFRRQKFELSDEAFSEFLKYKPVPEPPERIQTTTRAGQLLSTRVIQFLRESVEQVDARRRHKRLIWGAFAAAALLLTAVALAFQFGAVDRRTPQQLNSATEQVPPDAPRKTALVASPPALSPPQPEAPRKTALVASPPALSPPQPEAPKAVASTSATRSQHGNPRKSTQALSRKAEPPPPKSASPEPDEFDVSPFRKQR